MRVISDEALAILASKRFMARVLVKMIPGGGGDPLCIWDDVGSISVGGDTYIGAAGRFTISPPASVSDLSVRSLTITFSGLDSVIVGMIEGIQWHQQPIELQRAVISIDNPRIFNLTTEFVGFMDKIVWKESSKGRPSTLALQCEDVSREYSLAGTRTASDADQSTRDPNDGFFSFAASATSTSVDWGHQPQTAPKQKSSSGGFFDFLGKIF